jgi:amino acid adenylation domain-containing protein
MLPLADLDQQAVDGLVARVSGGAGNVQDIYPLAPLQEGILYHHLAAVQGDPYLQYMTFAFDTASRLEAFTQALQVVVARHDILRTAVLWEGLAEPVQVVLRQAQLDVEPVLLDPTAGDIAGQLHERFDPRHYRLDIRQAPMMRVAYAQDPANQRWVGILLFHHLVDDATSLGVLAAEIEAHMLGQAQHLLASVPYRNYVAQARLGVSREAHEGFFRDMLGDVDEPTLPFGLLDVQGDGSGIEEVRQDVSADLARRLRSQARQLGVSPASLYHLVWAQVLGAVSGRDDVVFGTVLVGRMQGGEGADRALGMFINTLPLRVSLGQVGVRAGVKATHARLTALLGHEHASLVLAQRCSGVEAPMPLFSALLNYRHTATVASTEALTAWSGIELLGGEERTNYPLTLSVDDQGGGFRFSIMTPARIGAQRLCGYVQQALHNLIWMLEQTPEAPLHQLAILPTEESEQLLEAFNATQVDYPEDPIFHRAFEAQAERTPQALAVQQGEQQLSYRELNARANRLAHYLLEQGVKPDSRVAICVERSLDMVVGLLAILKAGGSYVPLDPAYPLDRIAYMLEDSAPAAVLAEAGTCGLLTGAAIPLIAVDGDAWLDRPTGNPSVTDLIPAHLAYVIYTSGSTGKPKGVMVEHRNLTNLLWAMRDTLAVAPTDRVLALTTLGFDIAGLELYLPLVCGAGVVLATRDQGRDGQSLAEVVANHGVTVAQATPASWRMLLESGWPGDQQLTALCGGEALPAELAQRLGTRVKTLFNVYGPTETTIWSSSTPVEDPESDDGPVNIGRPIANTRFYLLNAHGKPVPVGVAGELYIGGAGVARGYMNRDELTAERFLCDPFSDVANARMYRTGDLGRYLPDGRVEYLGRNDDQVKIRGFRIELGEIEARLAQHADVKDAVVLVREDMPGEKRLVAYFTQLDPDATVNIETLRMHLQSRLPGHMVPAAYVRLDLLPLTPNGKLDRKALPAPDLASVIRRGYEAPVGDTEITLAQLWAEILNVERVGRHDDFFELGGHSLLAVSLMERMRQEGMEADVRTLFEQPTLSDYAAMTEKMEIVL